MPNKPHPLAASLLAGLQQENANPDAADERFAERAGAIGDEHRLLPADDGQDIAESAEDGQPGFTGEITDKLGRKVHFVNGKRVKGSGAEASPAASAKLNGQDAHILQHDPESGLVRVRTAKGTHIVKAADLDLGEPSGLEVRKFYRGTVPGSTQRIDEPFEAAKGKTFVARRPESAKSYGESIEEIHAKEGAKILDQESPEFWRLLGRRRPPNNSLASVKGGMIPNVNAIIKKAEAEGYDAVSFSHDADVGTVILNEGAFIRDAAPKPAKAKLGKSKAPVSVRMDEEKVDKRLGDFFPGMESAEERRQAVADVVGAPDDAEVFIYPDGELDLKVSIKHKDIKRADRTLSIDLNENRYIHNDYLEMKKPGGGLGTQIFARQVENAVENGFAYIETIGGGSHDGLDDDGKFKPGEMGGYYLWPQVGYDVPLDEVSYLYDYLKDDFEEKFPEAKTVRDVILSPGGMAYWKTHGQELSGLKFDLSEGSESREMLDIYLEKKSRRK